MLSHYNGQRSPLLVYAGTTLLMLSVSIGPPNHYEMLMFSSGRR